MQSNSKEEEGGTYGVDADDQWNSADIREAEWENVWIDRYLTGTCRYTVDATQMRILVVLTHDVAHVAHESFVDRYTYTVIYAAIP